MVARGALHPCLSKRWLNYPSPERPGNLKTAKLPWKGRDNEVFLVQTRCSSTLVETEGLCPMSCPTVSSLSDTITLVVRNALHVLKKI